MKYEVKGFEWVHWRNLEVHPEAKVPIADEDAAALKASVGDNGMIQPLLVIPRDVIPGKEKATHRGNVMEHIPPRHRFWIVDGANRFAAHKKDDADVMPCVVVKLAPGATVRDLALECASVGRSRSAGQRIMVYLERHKEIVLEAAEKGQEASRFGTAVSRDTAEKIKDFSVDAIAKTLGVSNKDTLLGIELLNAYENHESLVNRHGALVEGPRKLAEDDPEWLSIVDARNCVLAGTLPIRRMKAAVGGRAATKEVGRAETNVVKSGVECAKKFKTFGGKAWGRIPMEDRILVLDAFRKVRELVPDEVLTVLRAEWEERESASRK